MSSSETTKTPFLKTISVEAGTEFLDKVTEFCIREHSELVTILAGGKLPICMLEFASQGLSGSILARRAGYKNSSGKITTSHQTAAEYRAELIAAIISKDPALSKASPSVAQAGAIAILFPENEKTSREKARYSLQKGITSLLQYMMLLWPSKDIQRRLLLDSDIEAAYESGDLIRWVIGFNSFCLNSSGNKLLNAERAEATLNSTKMIGLDLPKYTKLFQTAANNVHASGSLYDEKRIVATFVRNLNHSEGVFQNWYTNFLDRHHHTFVMTDKDLNFAISYAEDHMKSVILPEVERKKSEGLNLSSIKAVEEQLSRNRRKGGSSQERGPVTLPYTVLATIFKAGKRKDNSADVTAANPTKKIKNGNKSGDTAKEVVKEVIKKEGNQDVKIKKPCFAFASKSGCRFGEGCRFSHTA
jgi:hypothetical protein